MINTVLFDLDGTLLPMDQDLFTKTYFGGLAASMADLHEAESLISAVWAGTRAMIKNDGKRTNEAVFWETYTGIFGPGAAAEEPRFASFYEHHFGDFRTLCGKDPAVPALIKALKDAGYKTAIATNPLFPMTAQLQRINWAGADPADFARITSYENSRFCKPDPRFYLEVLASIGAAPEESLMVGNDVREDIESARAAGMQAFLIPACLLNRENKDLTGIPQGDFDALRTYIEANGFAALPA